MEEFKLHKATLNVETDAYTLAKLGWLTKKMLPWVLTYNNVVSEITAFWKWVKVQEKTYHLDHRILAWKARLLKESDKLDQVYYVTRFPSKGIFSYLWK